VRGAAGYPLVQPRIAFLTNLGEMRLDTQTGLTIYPIFQEGITNVIKNAQATQTSVGLHLNQPRITLTIRDNGVGFDLEEQNISNDPAGKGIGLLSIKERARALGGTVELISKKTGEPADIYQANHSTILTQRDRERLSSHREHSAARPLLNKQFLLEGTPWNLSKS
jgi:signal transduction histidine kinase